ncbi:MAG: hypothetical protein NVSMB29_17870 [Candidatus Dormibacteria bacterium]
MSRRLQLRDLAGARSGDKGDLATVALLAPTPGIYSALVREVTPERVAAHVGALMRGRVDRFELPRLLALHLVLHGALNGGAGRSLRSDSLGKSYGALLLRLEIQIEDRELEGWSGPRRPPS